MYGHAVANLRESLELLCGGESLLLLQVNFLENLGLQTHWVCNLASRVPGILGRDPKTELQPVIDYIKGRGITGADELQFSCLC